MVREREGVCKFWECRLERGEKVGYREKERVCERDGCGKEVQ